MKHSIPSIAQTEPSGARIPEEPFARRRFLAGSCAVLLVLAASLLVLRRHRDVRAQTTSSPGTMTLQPRPFENVLRLAGTTEAVHSLPVLAPTLAGAQLNSMIVTRLTPAGTHVRKGDLLVAFDPQSQVKDFLDKQAAYRDLVAQVAQKKAANDAARAADDLARKQAEDALEKARLEVAKNELVSRIDAEINQENLLEAQATLKQLKHTYALKRQAAAADLQSLEIKEARARATMLYAQANEQKLTIRSPMNGVVVLNTTWLGGRMGQVQEGDQVQSGVPFLRVVDPSEMDVRVNVNQQDLPLLRIGQSATVHLDAYPGLSFPGTLEELTPLGDTGQFSSRVRTFAAIFTMRGNSPKLMPDLSAAVDVLLDASRGALAVPNQSLSSDPGGEYVWLESGFDFRKQYVTTGPRNDLETVVLSGLVPGEVIRETAEDAANH